MGRTGQRWGARLLAPALAVALLAVPLVGGVAVADHGARTLDLDPEAENSGIGTRRSIKGILSSAPDVAAIDINFEIAGPNDPDNSSTVDSPDLSCTVELGAVDDGATANTDESTTCTVSYSGPVAGDDVVRGWIADATPDMTEGQDAGDEPGTQPEPDATDVVGTLWFDGLSGSTRMDCSPESATASVGSSADIFTCEVVRTSSGAGVAGVLVDGEKLGGANDGDNAAAFPADLDDACTTGADGRCKIRIEGSSEAGTAEICFWADEDDDAGMHATSEWDGGDCDEGAADGPTNLNKTDVVKMAWKHDRSVTTAASVAKADYGQMVTIAGAIDSVDGACAGGVDVHVSRKLMDGSVEDVTTATTAADGSYSTVAKANRGAKYSAIVDEDATCSAAASGTAQVLVKKKVGLRLAKTKVAKGSKVRIRAALKPSASLARQRVVLFKSTNGGATFKRVAAKDTNANGVAWFGSKVRKATLFQARSPKQDVNYIAGRSVAKLVQIRK
ncbi:MAG: hypothetical protein ABR529_13080 [Actinomycetota bacterium]